MIYQLFNLRTGEFHGDISIMKEHEVDKLNRIRQLNNDQSRWIENNECALIGVSNNLPETIAKFSMFSVLLICINIA